MRLSTKGRYGLRLMVTLAARHGSGPVGVDVIAREQAISAHYIHVLMGTLKRAGLVTSLRGRDGGYELSRDPGSITALDVVCALEGQLVPVDCVEQQTACSRSGQCPTRKVWAQLAEAVHGVLSRQTLADLVPERSDRHPPLLYCI